MAAQTIEQAGTWAADRRTDTAWPMPARIRAGLMTGHAHGAASSGTTSISFLLTNSWMPSQDSSRP